DIVGDELFLVMEFVAGATVSDLAEKGQLPLGFSLAAIRDVALALHDAHSFQATTGEATPIIHRDVSPRNIMVSYDGVTKLLDFGIAKPQGSQRRTAIGMVRGTSAYMSPEQASGESLDPRTDLFSLGIVLHELLTGQRLFRRRSALDEMLAVDRDPIPVPSKLNSKVPAGLDAVAMKL